VEVEAGGGVEGGDAVEKKGRGVEEFVTVDEVFTGKGGGKESPTLAKDGGEVFFGGKAVEDATEGEGWREEEEARAVGGGGWRGGCRRPTTDDRRLTIDVGGRLSVVGCDE